MRYFLDTEFNGLGGELISLALCPETEAPELYIATKCFSPIDWVRENVVPIVDISRAHPRWIAESDFGWRIAQYLECDSDPVIVADWPDDISYFCRALIVGPGQMVALPGVKFEIARIDAYPTELEGAVQHNAMWDARALRQALSVSRNNGQTVAPVEDRQP